MSATNKLDRIVERHGELMEILASGTQDMDAREFARLSKEYSDMASVVASIKNLRSAEKELKDLEDILSSNDLEMRRMAQEERDQLRKQIPELEHEIKIQLLPKDETDERSAIIEIRAGTGGDEAALFASDLARMYQRYAEIRGWKWELLHVSANEIGGIKDMSASINGLNAFGRLKFESGVHRVQRVPATEGSGRIHTSAATVAVLPEAEEVDIIIDEKDLRIDVFRSSGPGGQHVNTTDSAVRITHIPTGVVVAQQDEKSQHKNKAKAMKILRARLYEAQWKKQQMERAADRRSQIGTGDRSERIRTYNFPQGRVTDHRIGLTLHKIESILEGTGLEELINALIEQDHINRLADLEDNRLR